MYLPTVTAAELNNGNLIASQKVANAINADRSSIKIVYDLAVANNNNNSAAINLIYGHLGSDGTKIGDLMQRCNAIDQKINGCETTQRLQGQTQTALTTRMGTTEAVSNANAQALAQLLLKVTANGQSIATRMQEITALQRRSTAIENDLSAKERRIQALESSQQLQGQTLTSLQQRMTGVEERLTQETASHTLAVNQSQARIQRCEDSQQTLRNSIATTEQLYRDLANQFSQERSSNTQLTDRVRALEAEKQTLNQTVSTLENKIEKLTQLVQGLLPTVTSEEPQPISLNQQVTQLSSQLQTMNQEFEAFKDTTEAKDNQLITQIDQLKGSFDTLQNKVANSSMQPASARRRSTELNPADINRPLSSSRPSSPFSRSSNNIS